MTPRSHLAFGGWMVRFVALWTVVHAFEFGLVGVALALPVSTLVLPYIVFCWCGFALAALAYWAREPLDQPPARTAPRRFAVLMFAIVSVYMSAALFSAVALGVVTSADAMAKYAPFILPSSVILAVAMLFEGRRRLRGRLSTRPGATTS